MCFEGGQWTSCKRTRTSRSKTSDFSFLYLSISFYTMCCLQYHCAVSARFCLVCASTCLAAHACLRVASTTTHTDTTTNTSRGLFWGIYLRYTGTLDPKGGMLMIQMGCPMVAWLPTPAKPQPPSCTSQRRTPSAAPTLAACCAKAALSS